MTDALVTHFRNFVISAAPALRAAFVKAAKVGAYIVLSAAIAAAYAYIDGKTFDPWVFAAVNTFLASAKRAIDALNQ